VERLGSEDRSKARSQEARLAELRGQVASLEGQNATAQAVVRQLESALEQRKIRAPIAGHIAELSELRVGSVVGEGARLGALVPAGKLKAVALFDPPAALGRVRPGQLACLRLDGFPWTQYGTVPATVTSVADEVRDGHIRAELAVHPDPASPIPLQHGLPGTVEVEVERVTPATLVLRAAGRLLAEPAESGPASVRAP
jgi:multidrug resistance efflux pump